MLKLKVWVERSGFLEFEVEFSVLQPILQISGVNVHGIVFGMNLLFFHGISSLVTLHFLFFVITQLCLLHDREWIVFIVASVFPPVLAVGAIMIHLANTEGVAYKRSSI